MVLVLEEYFTFHRGRIGYATLRPIWGVHPKWPSWLHASAKPVNDVSNCMDAFPSVHLAASLYLLLFDWQHWRRRFSWVLTPCLMLWLSTMYLRFHYFVHVLAGMVVALVGWWMAEKYEASTGNQPMLATEISDRKARP